MAAIRESLVMTKFYRDEEGKYIGAFGGETGKVPLGAIEIPKAPADARAIWDGSNWIEPVPIREDLIKQEVLKQGLTEPRMIEAMWRYLAYGDQSKIDELKQIIADAEKKFPEK